MAIHKREITKELQESYLDYAMSVIVSRALPDVRDGLKPVHRRVLWAMWDAGLTHLAKSRKSANVVGETMAKYHPHGDTAIYDTLVRMAQDFSMRYPLVRGQGNFGSVDGDSPAAMRYCVTGNTLVVTENGLVPIEKISEKNEENVSVKILSRDKAVHTATKWFDSGNHPTLQVTTRNGFTLRGSYNHPILTWVKHSLTGEPSFQWKLLEELKEGDIAVVDRTPDLLWPTENFSLEKYWPTPKNKRIEKKILPRRLDENLAHILGALVSEGTIHEKEIEFCNSDPEWILEFERRWAAVFPDCRVHHFYRKPNSFGKKPYETLEIHSQHIVEFLRNIGLTPDKAREKKIPFSILRSSKPAAASFLRAYFEGDGSISWSSKMTELSAISASENLIQELQVFLLRFGIVGTKRFDKHRGTHKLYLRGLTNYVEFQNEIGFISKRKREKLRIATARLHKDYSQTDFVPLVAEFIRSLSNRGKSWEFLSKHNFDRYPAMRENQAQVATAVVVPVRPAVESLFTYLLEQKYIFDPIVKIENAEPAQVYSIKVESVCHSFVANGFINHNTEAKLSKISEEILLDIEKGTVDWAPNYDATREEPKVLPAKLPNLLLNGSFGIAVGMATSIPPHNLNELADAILHLADHPEATTDDLLQFVKGPDFPTGGIIFDHKAIREAYRSGRGAIMTRAKAEITERKNRGFDIVVTEIPYQVNKAELVKKIADLAQGKTIEGIKDLRDESDREGMRVVIELKNDVSPQRILNQLYKHTDLQKDFHLNMIALVGGINPRLLALRDFLTEYLDHRKEVIRRRTEFDLARAKERAHILEGLVKALDAIDRVIATIKKSKDKEDAHKNLVKQFTLTDVQATAILEMRLQTLAALEREKVEHELKEKRALIKELELVLKSAQKMLQVMKGEVEELKKNYGDARRTQVVATGAKEFKDEDLIPEEGAVITLSSGGYVKRISPDAFQSQRRGGKGLIGSDLNEEDFLTHFVSARTHDNILFFTTKGRVFQTKVHEIPAAARTAKGRAIHNFLEFPGDEDITAVIAYHPEKAKLGGYLLMVTKSGMAKKTSLADFQNIRRTGIIAISLKKGDSLGWVRLSGGKDECIVTTEKGQAIRFRESQVREMGRTAAGIRAIKLRAGDRVAGFDIIKEGKKDGTLLVVMANGFGKRTKISEYKVQNRGGSGIKTANVTAKTGILIAARMVSEETDILALSAKGQIIRTALLSVRLTGRAAQGVRVMNLKSGDRLAGIIVL